MGVHAPNEGVKTKTSKHVAYGGTLIKNKNLKKQVCQRGTKHVDQDPSLFGVQ